MLVTIFFSCEKSELSPLENEIDFAVSEGILEFESINEVTTRINEIANLSIEEKIKIIKSGEFKSIGLISDLFYHSIDFEKFSTQEELLQFIEENSIFLTLKKENDELFLDASFADFNERYISNSKGMYVAGNEAFRIFEDFKIVTSKQNLPTLESLTQENYLEFVKNNESSYRLTNLESQRIQQSCKLDNTERNSNGPERIYINVAVSQEWVSGGGTWNGWRYMLRGYRRTLGVWGWATRTITGRVNFQVSFRDYNGDWQEGKLDEYFNSGNPVYSISNSFSNNVSPFIINTELTMDAINSWAKIPATGRAEIKCNDHLVP